MIVYAKGRAERSVYVFSGLLLSFAAFIAGCPTPAQGQEPAWNQYGLKFASPPTSGNDANSTFSDRSNRWIAYAACGQENEFFRQALDGRNDPTKSYGDGVLGMAMAKLALLKLGGDCRTPLNDSNEPIFRGFNIVPRDDGGNVQGFWEGFLNNTGLGSHDSFLHGVKSLFGPDCADYEVWVQAKGVTSPFATVNTRISRSCLKAQVNFVLNNVKEGDKYPGTDGLPCDVVGKYNGDWDATMKTLIRIVFLDSVQQGNDGGESILSSVRPDGRTTRDYILQDLITLEPQPGQDTYSWAACGDNEKDTGSPQDREDDNNVGSDFLDSVGDIFTWLLRRLLLIVLIFGVLGTIAALAGALTVTPTVVAAVVAVVGLAGILAGRVPETENHRLMIESTRFLNNQLVIQALGADNAPSISNEQRYVKAWLLRKFQNVAQKDFVEYNARPYQQYSLPALSNLADFSTDPDVRNGAEMLLEYSAAKFAVGSNQGRRLVPFRRRLPAVGCIVEGVCEECYATDYYCGPDAVGIYRPFEIFRPKAFGDFQIQMGLLFNGQTQQLKNGMVLSDARDAATATSRFRINPLITDLAIRKDVDYFQRIHHAGYEVYSSSPSVLITAGGIETDHASHFMVGPLPIHTPFDATEDIGAALPTTVMFTGDNHGVTADGQAKMFIGNFITFQGNLDVKGTTKGHQDRMFDDKTFNDNLCVWRNFACGINLRIPPDIARCMELQTRKGWYFVDSSSCAGYTKGPRFYLVMVLICPADACFLNSDTLNSGVAGFLEVVDAPSDTLLDFENKVLSRNPVGDTGTLGGCLTGGDCKGYYHTMNGTQSYKLELDLRGHQDDSNKTGITSINDVPEKELDEWPLAEGDIINSQGDGVIAIRNPLLSGQLILDFSDVNHPCRRTGPGQPCTQD